MGRFSFTRRLCGLELFEQGKSVTTGKLAAVAVGRNGCGPNTAAPSQGCYRPSLPDGYPSPGGPVG